MLHDGRAITTVERNNSVMLTADRKRNDRIGFETKGPPTYEAERKNREADGERGWLINQRRKSMTERSTATK